MKKINIGKNTLGDSGKMAISLKEYGRSTHNMNYAWRSTMGVGTLVPFMKVLALPGDTMNIQLDTKIMTHPTIGPLFGSYKFQADVFTCPIRLYNAMLHNNALGVGLDMKKVKLPKLQTENIGKTGSASIWNYFGIKEIKEKEKNNAVPYLGYLDIFKNYYANKQEDNFYVLKNSYKTTEYVLTNIDPSDNEGLVKPLNTNISQSNTKYNGLLGESVTIDMKTLSLEIPEINRAESYIQITITDARDTGLRVGDNGRIYLNQEGVKIEKNKNKTLHIELNSDYVIAIFEKELANASTGIISINRLFLSRAADLSIQAIELSKIDELREDILAKGRSEYIIGSGGNCSVKEFNNEVENMTSGNMTGLLLKTHFSDIFNNWVNTEWVDGDNGINKLTSIDTSGGSFSIDTLNLAEKVYNLLNRIAVSGGTYKDWIETVYTTDYYFRAETPIYEGGMSTEIEFSEVTSTSATEIEGNEPLGTLAGKGYASNKEGGHITIKVNEPSYIIGIASITPRVDYSQGNDWDNELDTLDDLHKPQLDGIGYQDLMQKWMHAGANRNAAVGKTVAWINYMTNFNKTYGNFAAGQNEAYMVLNRTYEVADGKIINATTYINPKEFTGTFATNTLYNQDFWVQIGVGLEARRVMSAKQIPIM
jgi:hypothetical protein